MSRPHTEAPSCPPVGWSTSHFFQHPQVDREPPPPGSPRFRATGPAPPSRSSVWLNRCGGLSPRSSDAPPALGLAPVKPEAWQGSRESGAFWASVGPLPTRAVPWGLRAGWRRSADRAELAGTLASLPSCTPSAGTRLREDAPTTRPGVGELTQRLLVPRVGGGPPEGQILGQRRAATCLGSWGHTWLPGQGARAAGA